MTSNTNNLIADIGGTNARFALSVGNEVHDEMEVQCAEFPTLVDAVEHYLNTIGVAQQRPQQAAFAIAAALNGDHIHLTNSHWEFSIQAVCNELKLKRLIVVNDFTALAMAVRHLHADELMQVGGSQPEPNKPIAVLGPGTGLGVSGLIPAAGNWIPLEGEGGHVSWSPADARETAVLNHLWKTFSHVSTERVLSGMGLVNVYTALCALDNKPVQNLQPADITTQGLNGTDATCVETLQMFCGILGSAAANLVLTLGAKGGVYIAGGIVPRLGDYFLQSPFRQRFEHKGRYDSYLASIPAYVMTAKRPAFTGLVHAFTSHGPRIEVVS
jgi:glucokinase